MPDIEIFLELIRNKYEQFNPCDFHDNAEDYFETLQRWELQSEQRRNFKPKRHKKILGPPKWALIRGSFFINFNFFWNCTVVVDIYILDNRKCLG